MTFSVDVCVQHHPSRADQIGPLVASIPGCRVIADPEPEGKRSAWRTYRACLTEPVSTTHRLIIQDDTVVCPNFAAGLRRVVDARPHTPIVLFVGGQPRELVERMAHACNHDQPFVVHPPDLWVPAVAVVWPVQMIAPIVEWVDRQRWPPEFCADDEILGRATRALRIEVIVTVPSLVEHPDVVPSIGRHRRHMGGLNPDRVAWCFLDSDPCDIDWR